MIEYDITNNQRKFILTRSLLKGLILSPIFIIPLFFLLGLFWTLVFAVLLILINLLYSAYSSLKKESYKITIDRDGITKVYSNKKQRVLFVDVKGRNSNPNKNMVVLKIDPHKFFASPVFSFLVPDQYVNQVSALLPD